jgi:hypothetical protein
LKRFAVIAVLAAIFAGVSALPAPAASFDDTHPCPAAGPLLVCPKAQVGQPYNLQLIALAGCDQYWWEFTNGGLPPGLKMSSSGLVSGIPSSVGESMPWVQVHDLTASQGGYSWCGGDNKSQRQFVFTTVAGLSIQDDSVPGGTIGQAYSKQLSVLTITSINPVVGSPANANWSIQSGTLPPGVSFSQTGLLSGTPTAEGSYTFVVKAEGGGATDTETETLVVRQPVTLTSTLGSTKAEIGIPFSVSQSAAGGSGTFKWSVSKGTLPAGLALGADGTVSGTPSVAGHFPLTVTVTDSESRTKSLDVTLVVAPKLAFRTLKLRAATTGVAYRAKIATLGGVPPLTWTVRGKLPKGVKFASRIATLIGTPTTAGKYRLTFTAADALGATVKKTLTLVVSGTTARR